MNDSIEQTLTITPGVADGDVPARELACEPERRPQVDVDREQPLVERMLEQVVAAQHPGRVDKHVERPRSR